MRKEVGAKSESRHMYRERKGEGGCTEDKGN